MKRLILYLSLLSLSCLAQTAATLEGVVKDPDGSAVPEAKVLLYREGATGRDTTVTDAQGIYRFERVQQGRYVLEVERTGFRSTSQSAIVATAGATTVDITLQLGGVTQSVIVTASDAPQTVDEVSKAVSVLSAEEITARNEISLAEALRTTPGVQVLNLGGPGQATSMRIRGLRSDATAILIDGLRFRDASTTQSDASSFLSALNFNGADRVEVLRGSGSSLYGTNAVGGVVNVISQDGGSPTHGSLLLEGGQLGLFRGKASAGGGAWGDRLRYSGSLLHLNVVNGVDGNDANRSTGGQGFVRFDLNESMNITGRVLASDDFVQLNSSPGTTLVPSANFGNLSIVPVRLLSPQNVRLLLAGMTPDFSGVTVVPNLDDSDNRRSSRHHATAVIFRHAPNARANWQSSYQRVHTSRVFENGPGGPGYQPLANNYGNYVGDIDTLDARGSAILADWFTVNGGYELEREQYFDRQDNSLAGTSHVATRTNVSQRSNAGYFASQIRLLGQKLQISTSGRAQFFSLSRPQFVLTGVANNYDRVPLQSPPKALTGDVSISYMLNATNTKLRAHVGNSYRAPSLYERFGGGFSSNPITGEVGFTPYGDPRLHPDRYNSVDAGVDQYLFNSRVRASATWFYNRVVTITAFDSSGVVNTATDPYGRFMGYVNGSGGISRGAEVSIEAKPTNATTLQVAYTYLNGSTDRDITVPNYRMILRVQNHITTFVLTHSWTRRITTNLDFFYGSDYFDSYYAAGRSRPFRNPGFAKCDLTGSYLVWEGERAKARLYGKVENLFDKTYYHSGYLAPGAVGTVGMQMHF